MIEARHPGKIRMPIAATRRHIRTKSSMKQWLQRQANDLRYRDFHSGGLMSISPMLMPDRQFVQFILIEPPFRHELIHQA